MFKHILIATDGSPISNKAAKAAIALARALGSKVTAYCAPVDLQIMYAYGYVTDQSTIDGMDSNARDVAQKRVDAIGKLAKAAEVPFTSLVTSALTVYEGIINVARKRKCDVIVMGSHGRRGFSKLIMGSVTQKVLALSRIPVVVYR